MTIVSLSSSQQLLVKVESASSLLRALKMLLKLAVKSPLPWRRASDFASYRRRRCGWQAASEISLKSERECVVFSGSLWIPLQLSRRLAVMGDLKCKSKSPGASPPGHRHQLTSGGGAISAKVDRTRTFCKLLAFSEFFVASWVGLTSSLIEHQIRLSSPSGSLCSVSCHC